MSLFLRAVLSTDITVCLYFLGPSCQQTLLYVSISATLRREETQHHAQTDCRDPETSTDLPTGANKHLPRPLTHVQIPLFAFVRTFNTRNCSDCQQQAGLSWGRAEHSLVVPQCSVLQVSKSIYSLDQSHCRYVPQYFPPYTASVH